MNLVQTLISDRCEPYCRDDRYKEDKYHSRNLESSVSTRLRGRISVPGTSERDASRLRGRRSSEEPLDAGARNLGGKLTKREDVDSLNFSGPKSLAELKPRSLSQAGKCAIDITYHVKNVDVVGKAVNYQEPEGASSFEGPKLRSVYLKRRREDVSCTMSSSRDEDNKGNGDVAVCAEEVKPSSVLESNIEESDLRAHNVETVEEVEDSIPSRDDEPIYDGEASAKEDTLDPEEYIDGGSRTAKFWRRQW